MRKALPFLLALLVAPLLAGCPALDILEGKESPHKRSEERRAALLSPADPAPSEPIEADSAPVKSVTIVEPPSPSPPCHDVFRVVTCIDGVAHDYNSGAPL